MSAKKTKYYIPEFPELWDAYWNDTNKPDSFSTLLNINRKEKLVSKAYVKHRLIEALQSNKPIPSSEKTGREAQMLYLLNSLDVPAPKILGINSSNTVMVMEYIDGSNLADLMIRHELTLADVNNIALLLSNIQAALISKKEEVASRFPVFPGHTGDVTKLLDEVYERTNDAAWAHKMDSTKKQKFRRRVALTRKQFLKKTVYYNLDSPIYGDYAVNNIIRTQDGKLEVIDPILCLGRRSMDLGRLGRSMVVQDIESFNLFFPLIISAYNKQSQFSVDFEEVLDMLCVDLLRILSLFLNIPENLLEKFPSYVTLVGRDKFDYYMDTVVPKIMRHELPV